MASIEAAHGRVKRDVALNERKGTPSAKAYYRQTRRSEGGRLSEERKG